MTLGNSTSSTSLRACLFLVLLVPAMIFLNSRGSPDMVYWIQWAEKMVAYGPVEGFAKIDRDYPPIAALVIGGATWVGNHWNLDTVVSIKIVLMLVFWLSLFVFWRLTRNYWATVLAACALIVHAPAEGYLDIIYMPFLVAAMAAFLKERWALFATFFCLTCLVKWPALVFAPFFAMHIVRRLLYRKEEEAQGLKLIAVKMALPTVLLFGITVAIFHPGPMKVAFTRAFNAPYHKSLSLLALNVPWVATHTLEWLEPGQFHTIGKEETTMAELHSGEAEPIMLDKERWFGLLKIPFVVCYALLLLRIWLAPLSPRNTLIGAMLGYLVYFMLSTGVHENHLFPAVVVALFLFAEGQLALEVPVILAIMLNVNLFMFYRLDGAKLHLGDRAFQGIDAALLTALANIVAIIFVFRAMFQQMPLGQKEALAEPKDAATSKP